jgi:hypothetical protein
MSFELEAERYPQPRLSANSRSYFQIKSMGSMTMKTLTIRLTSIADQFLLDQCYIYSCIQI